MRVKDSALRLTATLLSFALIQASFGSRAWAQLVPRVAAVAAPIGGVAAAGSRIGDGSANFSAIAPLAPSSALLLAPSAAPSMPASAFASAAPATALAAVSASASPAAASAPVSEDAAANSPSEMTAAPASTPAAAVVRSRMAVRVAELKNFFTGGREEGGEANAPGPAATKRMLGRYVAATNSSQAGYETLVSASMPVYLDQTFHKISLMPDLAIVGAFSSVIGRQLSPLIINSMPLKKAYVGMLGVACIAAAAIGTLANLHLLTVLPLFGLMIVFRLGQAGAVTAERTVIPSVLGKDQVAMERLRGRKQSWTQVASALTQNGAAVLIVLLGTATKNLLIAPFFFLAAAGLLLVSLKIPKASDQARMAAWGEKAAQTGAGRGRVAAAIKNFAKQLATGGKVVMRDPALRSSAIITMLMVVFNVLTYSILGPTFGKFAVGAGADPSMAAPIMGLIGGLFSLGGLFAGKIVSKHARDIEAKHGGDPAAAAETARSSAMRWLKYGALSFLAVGAMALPLPVIGPLIHLGSHAAVAVAAVLGAGTILSMWKPKLGLALAMAPVLLAFPSHVVLAAVAFFGFGLLQVVASVKNDSFFDKLVQEKSPADYANAAAFVGASSMFAGMLGLTALKFLIYGALPFGIPSPIPAFAGLHGLWPFVAIFGALAVPATIAMYALTRRLDRLTKPK
ncbi:MAG: hypothetical protein ACHQ2Z_15170 [Elusimicrobiota bacterium]